MIQTSNYARQGNNPNSISISCTAPKWFEGLQLAKLAPTWPMVSASKSGTLSEEQYTEQYIALLEERKVDPEIFKQFPDGTMLLCYEKPTDFCHRHILAKWVEDKTGLIITEWKNEKEIQQGNQDALVDSVLEF